MRPRHLDRSERSAVKMPRVSGRCMRQAFELYRISPFLYTAFIRSLCRAPSPSFCCDFIMTSHLAYAHARGRDGLKERQRKRTDKAWNGAIRLISFLCRKYRPRATQLE